jgi:hypothetical protein
MHIKKKAPEVVQGRDSLCRHVYTQLFLFVVCCLISRKRRSAALRHSSC